MDGVPGNAEAAVRIFVPKEVEIKRIEGMSKELSESTGGYGLFSTAHFKKGDVVYDYPSEEWPKARDDESRYAKTVDMTFYGETIGDNELTVVICPDEHAELLPDGSVEIAGFDGLTNHSCDANMYYDEENSRTIATKDIAPGDEFTVDYHSHNWDEDSNLVAFDCVCKSKRCVGRVRGFKYMPRDMQERLFEQGGVSGYVEKMWRESEATVAK